MELLSENPTKPDNPTTPNGSALTDRNGWDGKLRVEKKAEIVNAEVLSDPDYSDEDAPPVEQILADEGWTTTQIIQPTVLIHPPQIS